MKSTQDQSLGGAIASAPQPEKLCSEDLTRELRDRAQQALSTSVHHALLSQQSLLLAQRFWALTDVRSGHDPAFVRQALEMLAREQSTGQAAAPFLPARDFGGSRQLAPKMGAAEARGDRVESQPPESPSNSSLAGAGATMRPGVRKTTGSESGALSPTLSGPLDLLSPQRLFSSEQSVFSSSDQVSAENRNSETEPSHDELPQPLSDSAAGTQKLEDTAEKENAARSSDVQASTSQSGKIPKSRGHRSDRRIRRAREFAERVRLMAPMLLERIRIRTRKGDLKPKLRTATEELEKTRRPAAVSTISLGILLLLMAITRLELATDAEPELISIISGFAAEPVPVPESIPVQPPADEVGEQPEEPSEETVEPVDEVAEMIEAETAEVEALPQEVPLVDSESTVGSDANQREPARKPGSTDSRRGAARKRLLEKYGGSPASESAVHLALEWLVSRQRRDGTWDFTDVGESGHPGVISNPTGATAYALLVFLGAGQTHRDQQSPYRRQIESGLASLLRSGIVVPAGLDLRGIVNKGSRDAEPNEAYYVQGAATLALCEACAMTRDRRLRVAAEEAVRFLVNSQDPQGGGWRYVPHQPGSTSATAVQLLALMSAKKAGIRVPDAAFRGVSFYLDSVQIDQMGRYGYEREKKAYQISLTAMALLSRMYLGWGRDDGDLRAGVKLLDDRGPYENLYYNYFATQVMRNWGGTEWQRWNERLRDDLIAWQEKEGTRRGSWAPRDRSDSSRAGGRLLTTCLAALTLEVYYRYEPLLPDHGAISSREQHPSGTGEADDEETIEDEKRPSEE